MMDVALIVSRLLPAVLVNLFLAFMAWKAGTIRVSGALAGFAIGFVIWLGGGWKWFLILAAFFVIGSLLTKLGYSKKAARGLAEADRGRRGWQNAVANAGVGAICAGLAIVMGNRSPLLSPLLQNASSMEFTNYPILDAAFVASFATALFDTAGSEIGGLYGKTPISLRTFQKVPAGTEGAVSLEGTLGALAAAAVLILIAVVAGVIPLIVVPLVLLGAVLGGLYESLAAGRLPLGHQALNFTNTLVGAILAGLLVWFIPG
jgi:uncharacterized protein (TIGR00297 family)